MTVGLDIDDTITRHPAFFAFVAAALIAGGHRVVIITLRVDRDRAITDLARLGVPWTELHCYPDAPPVPPYWSWKGEVCRQCGVDLYFDDSPDILEHIPKGTIPFLAVDLTRHDIALLREAEDE